MYSVFFAKNLFIASKNLSSNTSSEQQPKNNTIYFICSDGGSLESLYPLEQEKCKQRAPFTIIKQSCLINIYQVHKQQKCVYLSVSVSVCVCVRERE